ncbi:hypothetical protein AN639_05120 [Candidatus Epulonipiscium fishelsonii]|uniref:Uncharacterized protein n=1 Tax=Candidatus Epulonipiscium fishelsonii TaxID=77094 RepID=A0ACC8XBN2_9FIRM|nr:hypothetical protein AN396_06835 [Epulopiscium sp. SCG-B11WGA-EpuloA1]ONI40273.1 hypothetical protein AN639_05120 [Epulopiscium sp. SCG-B05WGA-EpuloA1]
MGVPVEFSSRKERDKDLVNEIRAYGTHHQPYGTWSDDTSLMLCLVKVMTEGYSLKKLSESFIKFYVDGELTATGHVFDIGNTTREAITKMINKVPLEECGAYDKYGNGNGSLMRILPLAFLKAGTAEHRITEEVSCLTHGHAKSLLACIIYVELARKLLSGLEKRKAYNETMRIMNMIYFKSFRKEPQAFNHILSGKLIRLPRNKIKSSGYVIDTLEASLWSFMNSKNYTDSILTAINLGGDTDTIGALTGGLAGLYYGFQNIPDRWIQHILKKEMINDMLHEFKNSL